MANICVLCNLCFAGGPLLVNGVQVGIVSWSVKPCGVPPYPGVFTKVSRYIEWIERHTGIDFKLTLFVQSQDWNSPSSYLLAIKIDFIASPESIIVLCKSSEESQIFPFSCPRKFLLLRKKSFIFELFLQAVVGYLKTSSILIFMFGK